MGSKDRDSTLSLIADAEELIKNKNAKKDAPQPTRELLAGAEKLVKNKPPGAAQPAAKKGTLLWAIVAAAIAAAAGLYLMR